MLLVEDKVLTFGGHRGATGDECTTRGLALINCEEGLFFKTSSAGGRSRRRSAVPWDKAVGSVLTASMNMPEVPLKKPVWLPASANRSDSVMSDCQSLCLPEDVQGCMGAGQLDDVVEPATCI